MDPALALEVQEISRNRFINETIQRGDSNIQKFFAGATIFITGGSGFLGKQLIEKLLRSCEIKKIYLLLRSKKNLDAKTRLNKVISDPAFDYLHKNKPGWVDKLVPVVGDIIELRLGINDEDWKLLSEEVEFIFHVAATIRFTEPLKKATLTNVRGTQEVLLLAKECQKLRSFVHISTAYSHATPERIRKDVLEKFYDTPIDPDALINMVLNVDEEILDKMTPSLLKEWPNTYSYTKAVAEEVVRTKAGHLPVSIIRPAIVICAYREPTPGWIDRSTALGPSGFIVGVGLGVLHITYCDENCNLDLVPVDFVNNATVAAAHETVVRRQRGETDIQIYTVTGTRNPMSFGEIVKFLAEKAVPYTTNRAVWYQYGTLTSNEIIFFFISIICHFIPGYMVDGMLLLIGKKPMLSKVYSLTYKLNKVLGYFMNNEWKFGDSNLQKLHQSMSPTDRTIYNFSMADLHWDTYLRLWMIGCRKYIIRDTLERSEVAVKKRFWFRIAHYIVSIFYLYGLYCICRFLFNIMSYFVKSFVSS